MPPPPTADNVLDLEVRRRIADFVRASPGLHMRLLADRLDLPVSTLEYHCHQLERHGVLATRDAGGFKSYYPAQGMDRRDKDVLYVVRHEAPRRICTHLLLHPGATPKDLRPVVDVSAPTLSFHLGKLRAAGIVREEAAGRTKRLYVVDAERVATLLVTYRQTFFDDAVDRFAAAWLDLRPPQAPAPSLEESTTRVPDAASASGPHEAGQDVVGSDDADGDAEVLPNPPGKP